MLKGHEYADWVAEYIVANYAERDIEVYREISIGKSIIGKNRRIDALVICHKSNHAVALECKFQGSRGTVDEKIPYALQDIAAMQMDSYLVYSGEGFSHGVIHLLQSSELACNATPFDLEDTADYQQHDGTRELDHILAMRFGWWDLLVANKQPVTITKKPSFKQGYLFTLN